MSGDRTHLLIPIHIDALAAGGRKSPVTVSAAPNYSLLKNSWLTGVDLRQPTAPLDPALEPGVHLHFRLPAAVAHGNPNAEPAFPKIPNRWLVQRYYKPASGGLRTKAWLVRGDKEAPGGDASAVVLFVFPTAVSQDKIYDTPFSFRPTGVAAVICDEDNHAAGDCDYRGDDAAAEVELTAVTGADAGFSAHYPACRSILGFHDDLTGVPANARLSYLVTGWYSSVKDDPWNQFLSNPEFLKLAQADKLARVQGRLEEHRCWKQGANGVCCFSDVLNLPAGILCHGRVTGVYRNQDGSAPGPDPDGDFKNPDAYWVDVGNTSAEALAARVAKLRKTVARDLLEDMVTAFQTGLFSQGTNAAALDDDLHRQGFAAVAGGRAWVIQREASAPQKVVPSSPPAALPPLPAELQQKLDELNLCERLCDEHARLRRDFRWELYALWHRSSDAKRQGQTDVNLEANLEALKVFVKGFDSIPQVITAKSNRKNAEDALRQALKGLSEAPGAPITYTLAGESADPFYAPKDPVVLLTGPALQMLGTRSRPQTVAVRVTGDEFALQDAPNRFQTTRDWLVKECGVSAAYLDVIPPWSARLLGEAMLQDSTKTKAYGISPDPFGVFTWKHNPWIPLYLYWAVSWRADYQAGGLAENIIRDSWVLKPLGESSRYGRSSDLAPTKDGGSSPPAEYHGLSFVGRPLVSVQAGQFKGKASDLLKQIDTTLGVRQRVMMSQSLGGLNDALMMRRAGDQLPPLNYDKWLNQSACYLDEIIQVLGADYQPDSSPAIPDDATSAPFCPLRAGRLELKDLWIIDAFGQRIRVNSTDFCQSGRMEAGTPAPASPPAFRLHPRFCRPMRLEFSGISAEASADAALPGSPICGWVVLNHFDQNLVLYAADGQPAGILQKRFESGTINLFYWVPVPGAIASRATVDGIRNAHLRDFAKFVLSLGFAEGGAFSTLINNAVQATGQRMPDDNSLVSVLIGRPFALVRAALRCEMDGLPALDQKQSWAAAPESGQPPVNEILNAGFAADTPPWPNRFMRTGNVEQVRWPVRLGDRRSPDDGLVGFFRGEPVSDSLRPAQPARPFYASWGFDFGNVAYPNLRPDQDLEMACGDRLQVTLLMDPSARVHVTSGVLPRLSLELPAAQLIGAKQVREVFFQTAPVLGTPTTPQVPKPSDDYGQWSWAYRPDVTGWAEDPNMVAAADLAGPTNNWPTLTEGWLKLKIEPVLIRSLWMKAPVQKPSKYSNVTIAWSLHGADAVELFRLRGDGREQSLREWHEPPLGSEWTCQVDADTTFEVRASNRAGYGDSKQITIQIEA